MRLVEHDQVPVNALDVVGLGLCELIGADDRAGREQERVPLLLLADRVVAFGFEDQPVQAELVLQLLMPLLAQVGGHDDENLRRRRSAQRWEMTKPGFDGLAETHFVGEEHAAREGVPASEERCLHLMRDSDRPANRPASKPATPRSRLPRGWSAARRSTGSDAASEAAVLSTAILPLFLARA
jgi:hypothetical protein